MAILKKRTSSRQLPSARGLDRAPLDSIIRGVDNAPALTGRGSSSITSAGGAGGSNAVQSAGSGSRPFTSAFTNPDIARPTLTTKTSSAPKTTLAPKKTLVPKTSLTTKTTTTPKTTLAPKTTLTSKTTPTTKPTITNKTSTTPTTKTTSPTSVVKPSVKPNISNPNSTTNKVVNALTGAAIGAGTKLLVDKITGKPVVRPPTGTTVPKAPAGGSKVPSAPAGGTKPPPAGNTKPTSVVKPPVINTATGKPTGTGFGDDQEEFTTDSLGNTYKTMPDGTSELYRAADVAEDEYMTDSLGNVYKTMPDGTYELYRAAEVEDDGSAFPSTPLDETFVPEYFQDSLGNIYISTADGEYDLYRAAEVEEDGGFSPETSSEPEYFEDSLGNVYIQGDSGEYELYRAAEVPEDILEEDYYLFNQDPIDYIEDFDVNDRYSTEEDDGDDYYDYRRGGLITMMKNGGGIRNFSIGGDSGNGGNLFLDASPQVIVYGPDGTMYGSPAQARAAGETNYTYTNPIPQGAIDNGDGTYTIGRFTYDMMTNDYLYSSDDGQITNVSPDAIYSTTPEEDYYDTDSLGNVFKNGEFYRAAEIPEDITSISNVGSGGTNTKKDVYQTDADGNVFKNGVFYRAAEVPEAPTGGIGSDFLNTLTGALGTTAGAAGAGALIASLLGSDFSGGTGNQNQGLDMSQVGVINPRTTDFGIGPTNFVGYEDYGTSDGDYTPNAELLKNLNAPGYNPVNEGDYGYEEVEEEVPQMASGGLSSMATPVASYYTFGQPADILANLGMRSQPPMNPPEMMPQIGQQKPPQQMQQQGLPQQMPPQMAQQVPQGMPQQGMMPQQQGMPPPMRKGGLPHASNVPMVEGRMDFRKGSAVHGAGDGQSDDIPAMLADGEYVIDAETVAQIGNGSTKAGAQALDKFRESIRAHKRSAPVNKIPPKTKALTSYLKGAK